MQSIIVSKDEIFNYRHINEILETDAHPPLYFYLLHFFSSFFIGRFSWVPSIIINSLSVFFMLIFFYRLFLLLCENRYRSMLAMIFFGLTSGVINMMAFSRNYAIMTAFTVIFTYYLFDSMKQHKSNNNYPKSLVFASLFLYLAAMSQYLSIVFAFILTLLVCIYYLFKKDIKYMLEVGLSMAASILLLLITFHYVIHQLMSDQTSMEFAENYPFLYELRISVNIIFTELFGIKTPVHSTMITFWIFWGIIGLIIICLLAAFIFRSEAWFIKFKGSAKKRLRNLYASLKNQRTFQYIALLITTVALICIISYKFRIYYFYPYSDRYLFILYPFVVILLFIPVFKFLKNKYLNSVLIITLLVSSLFIGLKPYIQTLKLSVTDVNDILTDSDIIVCSQNHYSGVILSLLYLNGSNKTFFTTDYSYEDNIDEIKTGLSNTTPSYMLYLWPTYTDKDVNAELLNMLKTFQDTRITTIKDEPKNYGAKLIDGVGSFVIIQLR